MPDTIPVAIVTGASRGLGRGIAVRLAELGFSVAVNFVEHEAAARETVALCTKAGSKGGQKFIAVKANMAQRDDRGTLVRRTLDDLGRIDALVSNAGMGPRVRADITETSEASFDEVLRVNLNGPFFLSQDIVKYWLTRKTTPALPQGFTIVFVSSISATAASLNRSEYCISKAGLSMARQLWALRLAPEGINVYEIRPGIMATDMTSGVREKYDAMISQGVVPQGRWGTPEDAGLAVGSLLTGAFRYSTGAVVYVDGGFHLERL